MNKFARVLREKSLESLQFLAEAAGQNWWKDLLSLWRLSGTPADRMGLRLAIRRNYFNLYSRGQSVARVRFTRAGLPYFRIHAKYVFGSDEKGDDYARLMGTEVSRSNSKATVHYHGAKTLGKWIKQANLHTKTEKTCIDDLVAADPSIIDLEMGLPSYHSRIDCVALERQDSDLKIVFWEAKMIDDPRLRSRSDPEVIETLKKYGEYFKHQDRAEEVVKGYRSACQLLIRMRTMVSTFEDRTALHPLVFEAAKENSRLSVDPIPRLVIFGAEQYQTKGNSSFHLKQLRTRLEEEKIPWVLLSNRPYTLSPPGAA